MSDQPKMMLVSMDDGTQWEIPAEVIARHRARYYTKLDCQRNPKANAEQVFADEMAHALRDHFELCDWASNNMNWSDVSGFARKVQQTPPPDYEELWVGARKQIVKAPPQEDAYKLARKES